MDIFLTLTRLGMAIMNGDSLVKLLVICGFALVRLLPLLVVCVFAEQATNWSLAGLRIIHRLPLRSLTRESQFQVRLFESTLLANPPKLSASGFVNVNKSLFMQIIGVIITYVVVMVQISQNSQPQQQ